MSVFECNMLQGCCDTVQVRKSCQCCLWQRRATSQETSHWRWS